MSVIKRKIFNHIRWFFEENPNKALLITGARQVGKTFIIRQLATTFDNFLEINFLENKKAKEIVKNASNSKDMILRLSALTNTKIKPNKTLVFFDEIQDCPDILTAIKFLVEEGSYKYILSGSLLGVELNNVRSVPVGYMKIFTMYPVDFEEFLIANNVEEKIIDNLKTCFYNKKPVDNFIHEKMMEYFRLYLIIGGMPEAINQYLKTNNVANVISEQHHILETYKYDISRYDTKNKLYLNEILDLIPSQLNAANKRFILKNLNENFKFSRYANSFLWLKNAGVAYPVYSVTEPIHPLLLSKSANLFKLFLNDVGLLTSTYSNKIQLSILENDKSINHGAIFENYAAQELLAHGYDLYYYNNKKNGEVDFLLEKDNEVFPIEIKSGKKYKKHSALTNLLSNKKYNINKALVFYDGNIKCEDKVIYLPIYMISFLYKEDATDDFVYEIHL